MPKGESLDTEGDANTNNKIEDNEEEGEDLEALSGVLPKRLSELHVVTKIKPIPEADSFYIFSHTNK